MPETLQKRSMQFVFAANLISMVGSGMNAAAVAWFVLQATGSEIALGKLTVMMSLPAMILMPFSGVIIDREDRRRLVMWLDALRELVILAVALLAFHQRVQVWQLYVMNMLVSAGFWMFWPTITALIQELATDSEYVQANTFLMVGVQGGWLIAGAIVGFVYEKVGLGGVLLIDFATYVVSFLCYFAVRRGKHIVPRPSELKADILAAETAAERFLRELREGMHLLAKQPSLMLLGVCWALFLGAMLTSYVVTPPLSDHVFHAGAVGYGWLNGGWGLGAFISGIFAANMLKRLGPRVSTAVSMLVLAAGMYCAPFAPVLAVAVLLYGIMGMARGLSGVAMNTAIMERVPKHFMGRVMNTFNFAGTFLQVILSLTTGAVAHRYGLVYGFVAIGSAYLLAFLFATWSARSGASEPLPIGGFSN